MRRPGILLTFLTALSVAAATAEAQLVSKQAFEANERKTLYGETNEVYSYEIQERTKNERVAVGEVRDVLRWGPTNNDDQRFIFYRLQTGKYLIQTLRPGIGSSKWLGVGSNGHLVAWTRVANNTQEFTIEWNADGSFSLKEPTKGEYVSVSGAASGRLIRWTRLADAGARTREQTFILHNPRKEATPHYLPWTDIGSFLGR